MLAEDPLNYKIADEDLWDYRQDLHHWAELLKSWGL